MKALALAFIWPALIVSAGEPSPWKLDAQPALAPGVIGDWDDWAIASPTILKHAGKWWMFFEGVQFDEQGVRSAFGIAQSDDRVAWHKHSQNPLFRPELSETQSCSAPSVTRWHDAFWMVYVISEDPFQLASETPVTTRLARSEDGLLWSPMNAANLPAGYKEFFPVRTCLYGEENLLHLWWIGPAGERDRALFHSVSRDGETWSAPNQQLAKEIDNREICCARVYPSGNFYLLSYVAYDESKRQYFLVTKTSRDARDWYSNGPPEFALPSHAEHSAPWIVFESNGARLFYSAQQSDKAQQLRSAYCEKKAYASP